MNRFNQLLSWVLLTGFVALVPTGAAAQRGPRHDPERQHDMATFQFLLRHRDEITRTVTKRKDGVETVTESENPEVVSKLREHVKAMHVRLKRRQPIHMRDALFREVFQRADQIKFEFEDTPQGLHVVETSSDPYVARLLQAHAEVLNRFLEHGHKEVRKSHAVPPRKTP